MAGNEQYTPSVTSSEIVDWERRFKESVTPLVQFDNQDGKASMKLYNGESGIEASWSGTIKLQADNYINWSFSIQNEAFVEGKFTLDEQSKKIINELFVFYSIWKDEWSKSLSIPPSVENRSEETPLPSTGPATTAAAPMKESYNVGNNRTRTQLIDDHSERMRRLAGLL